MLSPTAPDLCAQRRERLRARLHAEGWSAFLATSETNVRYLSGFTGDSTWLLLRADRELLLSDRRYETQLAEECPGIETLIRPPQQMLPMAAVEVLGRSGLSSLAFEASHVSFALHATLSAGCPGLTFLPTSDVVEQLRAIKDSAELQEIRAAVDQAIHGFRVLRESWTPEQTELAAALELEQHLRRRGARGFAFDPIIGVGDRAALPHYHAGGRRLDGSPLVLVDWGAETQSRYRSDLTRTLFTGPATDDMRRVYDAVLRAQQAALAVLRPGVCGREVDAAARRVLDEAGWGPLSHGLGHGFGLQIHEAPRLGPNCDHVLQPGMVVTVEPGIYISGRFGVRIEDDVLLTDHGCEVLSAALPNDWDWAQARW
jgi:Xaa-Pro aminopeptidase